jgi:hypothetical protein
MRIDCTQCEMYQSEHCEDCLVTAVLHPPAGPVEIDHDLDPPLRELTGAGLIPVLKFRPRREIGAESNGRAGPPDERGAGSAGPPDGRGAGSAGPQDGRGAGSAGPPEGLVRKAN